jgi:hypothetical protein
MLTANTLNKTLPHGTRPAIPLSEAGNSSQALRTTFDGWGPRL